MQRIETIPIRSDTSCSSVANPRCDHMTSQNLNTVPYLPLCLLKNKRKIREIKVLPRRRMGPLLNE